MLDIKYMIHPQNRWDKIFSEEWGKMPGNYRQTIFFLKNRWTTTRSQSWKLGEINKCWLVIKNKDKNNAFFRRLYYCKIIISNIIINHVSALVAAFL